MLWLNWDEELEYVHVEVLQPVLYSVTNIIPSSQKYWFGVISREKLTYFSSKFLPFLYLQLVMNSCSPVKYFLGLYNMYIHF